MLELIISQCFFGLGFLFSFLYTFFNVSRKTILYCGIIISLANAIGFILLYAWTGAAMNLLGALLNFIYFFKNRNKFFSLPIIPIIFEILFLTCGILTWESWISILPIIANVIYGISLWFNKEFIIKLLNTIINSIYLIYHIFFLSYVAIVGTAISILLGVAYLIWGEKYNQFIKNIFSKKNKKNC